LIHYFISSFYLFVIAGRDPAIHVVKSRFVVSGCSSSPSPHGLPARGRVMRKWILAVQRPTSFVITRLVLVMTLRRDDSRVYLFKSLRTHTSQKHNPRASILRYFTIVLISRTGQRSWLCWKLDGVADGMFRRKHLSGPLWRVARL